jgi:hypothetical protein
MLNKFKMYAALAVSIVSGSLLVQPAHATTYSFVLSGADNYSWSLDSNPTPTGISTPNYFYIANVPGIPANDLSFYSGIIGGGLSAGSQPGDGGSNIFDLFGEQLFTGTLSAPQFKLGTFAFDTDSLTISAETPLPSTWLLMLSGLVGLGFIARSGTKKRPAGFAAA